MNQEIGSICSCIGFLLEISVVEIGATMRFFLVIRSSPRRHYRNSHSILLMALLVSVWLAVLQCAHCFRVSRTVMGPVLFGQTQSKQYDVSIAQIGRQLGDSERHRARATRAYSRFAAVHPRIDLSSTSRARANHGKRVSAQSNSTAVPPAIEVEALATFKAAITSDPSGALSSWTVGRAAANGSDTCSGWIGVTCSTAFPNHVVALNLSNLELAGRLDSVLPILGRLPFLQSLDLSFNVFSGFIEGEALANFSRLSCFNVSSNLVTGEIPSAMGELVSLQAVDLSGNNITGLIPESLGNCSSLTDLYLGDNFLSRDIPTSLGALSYLEYLNVSYNSLSGSIPSALGNCSSLQVVDLGVNTRLEGGIPEEFSHLEHLRILDISHCALTGAFPFWIGNLSSLTYLELYGNNIRGEIPDLIGQLQHLIFFQVSDNQMTGVIPLSICNVTSLYYFSIINTNISGHIPPQIGTLPKLMWLNLYGNQLTGVIPYSLANCTTLYALQLGQNELMDPAPIPTWMDSLTSVGVLYFNLMNLQGDLSAFAVGKLFNLEFLAVAGNQLTGSIPIGIKNCTQLYGFEVGENRLTGDIPSELGGLRYMYTFHVANNYLTGSFPAFMANWSYLNNIELTDNLLSGELLPGLKEIDQLAQLSIFDVSGNDFEGPIPETLGNCTSLQQLLMPGNRLSGPIPSTFGNLTSMQILTLSSNSLQGRIPIEILNSCLRLGVLDLSVNELEGSIPLEIGHLVQLSDLHLGSNMFTGTVPSTLGNCSNIRTLNLSGNHLEGNIPAAAISKMSNSLTNLDLSHNNFSGSWPLGFTALKAIGAINVSSNNISGSIPLGLGHCIDLNSLDVSMNNLSGEIPQDLGSLAQLRFFNASFNNFMGPIPQSGIFSTSLINESSFLGNPNLCGPVAKLGLDHQACTRSGHHECTGFSCKQVWIPVAAVSALVFFASVLLILVGIKRGWIFRSHDQSDSGRFQKVLLNFDTHERYTERDVLQAIGDQNGDNIIGGGSRSIVYRGTLPGGQMFALKKLKYEFHGQNNDSTVCGTDVMDHGELVKEAKILAKLRHKNILRCLSFYSNLEHKALIVEYMSGGSLHKHLHEGEQCQLPWATRLQLALGVAEGMKYLHHDLPEPLIHRDLKPSNILLDAEFEPKIADFGISKFVTGGRDHGEVTASTFCGTMGYMPPEYASQTWVSTQGDVYSYGMVIIELLTRRQPYSIDSMEDAGMRNWVLNNYFDERPLKLLDQALVEQCNIDTLARDQMLYLLRVGLVCTTADPQRRPSMINVVDMLLHVINLGVEPVSRKTIEELANTLDPP